MDLRASLLANRIIKDISVGVFAIGFDGIIWYANDSACTLLKKKREDLENRLFATCFLECRENDSFCQMIINAISDRSKTHRSLIDYYDGTDYKKLHIETSFSVEDDQKLGIIVVISDMTEVVEMRDSLKSINKIKELNDKLEIRNKLLGDTFGRYLSDAIVRQILDNPKGLQMGGRKHHMTVMMSDLRGFTGICENMEAQNLVEMVNHYLGEMTTVISSFKGTIIEFLGDGILAIFGAPIDNENHASDAMAAAIAMQQRLTVINQWNEARGFAHLDMGIGICTGDMIVGNIGSERHAKYGVLGSNVNVCGRIESYTTSGQIYVSDATVKESSCEVDIEESLEISPKGLKEKLVIHRICGLGTPYNLSFKLEPELPSVLESSIPVLFHTMAGKFVDSLGCQGVFSALSDKSAVMISSFPLKRFDNIQIELPQERFAKVVDVLDKDNYLVTFTSN